MKARTLKSFFSSVTLAGVAALGLGAYAAPTATAVWRSNLGQSYTIGGNTFAVTPNGGALQEDGTIKMGNENSKLGATIALPAGTRNVSVLVKFSNLSIPTDQQYGTALATINDSSFHEVGVAAANTSSLNTYWHENGSSTYGISAVYSPASPAVVSSGYMLFSYAAHSGSRCYMGETIASLAGGENTTGHWSNLDVQYVSIGGPTALQILDICDNLVIEEVALFVGNYLTNTDVADYAFPTLDGETTALTMTELNTKIAADSNVIFTASPVVTLDVEPSDATKTYLQSAVLWNGTVFIKDVDKTNIDPTAYGNPNSTLKLSGVKGYFAARQFNSSATPAIELEDSATEGRVYGLYLNNGYSFESQGAYYWTQTPELKGSGTLKADSSGAAVLVVVDKWDNFTGKLELTNKAVYFGTGIPERAKNVVTAGTIKLNGTVPATIGTWTVGTAFTGSVLTLTTAANKATTAFLTNSTKWKGTCQLNWNHTSALDIVNYGNANSVVEIVSTFSAYPTQNGGNAAANLAAELKLSANWTVANGWDSKTTTFAKLSGTGNLIVNGASGGSTAIPYTITKIENFTGALGGARGQFTIGTIVASEEPVAGSKLVSLSNCTKTPVLTNTVVEYNGAAVEGITLEVKADGIYVGSQYVAQIKTGSTTENYTTLAAALDSENIVYGITLLADVTETAVVVDSAVRISGNYTINSDVTIANGGQLQLMLATLNGTLTIQGGGTYMTLGGRLGNVVVQDGGIIYLTTLSEDAAPLTVSNLTVNGALTIVSSYGLAERGKTYKAISYATGSATIAEGASFNGSGEWSASTVVDGDNTIVCLEITKVAVVDGVYYDTAQEAVEAAVASGKQVQFLVQPGTVTLGAGETLVVTGGYQPTVTLDAGLSTSQYEIKSTYDDKTFIYTYAVKALSTPVSDGNGNTFTVPAALPGGYTATAKVPGKDYNYAQAYAVGLIDSEGNVSEPTVSIVVEGGVAKVVFEGGETTYDVTCTLYSFALADADDETKWTPVATAGLGETLTDSEASDTAKFYKVKVSIKDAE